MGSGPHKLQTELGLFKSIAQKDKAPLGGRGSKEAIGSAHYILERQQDKVRKSLG